MPKRDIDQVVDADPVKSRVRESIAVQACESCRQKKARCDEGLPKCGACSRAGIDCIYAERRLTKKDQSLQIAINSIRRLESKIEHLTRAVTDLAAKAPQPSSANASDVPDLAVATAPTTATGEPDPESNALSLPLHASYHKISFSQHGVIHWPAVLKALPADFVNRIRELPKNYAVELERCRSPLPSETALFTDISAQDWLNNLPFRIVRSLTDAFFSTFNGLYPVLDRRHFFSSTLGAALDANFDYSIESTIVLLVLALGCLAVEGHREGNYPLGKASRGDECFCAPDWYPAILGEMYPGLSFFNEARKRMGFRTGSNNLDNCQVYLLCAFYYTQILRPIDSYLMLVRAASCSLMTLTCSDPIDFDTWKGDMESRVFWCCLMYETILVQELGVPKSGLADFEASVPLPKFKPFKSPDSEDNDDAFFHYHFLAQAANRIMLTRIANSHYFYDDRGDLPSPRIQSELLHQIAQWKASLPAALQFGDEPMPERSLDPGHALAEALLRSRHKVIHFHLGRPYLYKALHNPSKLTTHDLEACHATWVAAMHWPMVSGACKMMKSCMLIKFGWVSQLFGQLVTMYCFATSSDHRLRDTLPPGWMQWWEEIIELLEYAAIHSPTAAVDLELARSLQSALVGYQVRG
ncbi:uncharacterized protein PV09_03932 [Verruconis gallopava]|uniref:Zn(2)-C6 fungal-type domain-containing protein n=1 Tax=Verruconis gallopava TaxID=253628 RepID=A0A0D1YXJ1_9PEZI|nr:uncharacterized protein PV09_03932 [Verruconis gallopava]KIW05422.1 hypothetical protein PV09_03932 [Verruconis gallopava]